MAMPRTDFPRIALYGTTAIHFDGDMLVFIGRNGEHLLTLTLMGHYTTKPHIYHHESPSESEDNLPGSAEALSSAVDEPIPF